MYNVKFVRYHSHEWEVLVETGWLTATVDDNGIAHMVRADYKGKRYWVL